MIVGPFPPPKKNTVKYFVSGDSDLILSHNAL